jgi:hypothetical protein
MNPFSHENIWRREGREGGREERERRRERGSRHKKLPVGSEDFKKG